MLLSNQEQKNMAYSYIKLTLENLKEAINKATAFSKEDYGKIKDRFETYEKAVLFEMSLKDPL